MLTKAPFLTGFPTLLCGSSKRPAQAVLAKRVADLRAAAPGGLARLAAEEIPAELIAEHGAGVRGRTYDDGVTFWAFLEQVMSEDGSCARAVAGVQQRAGEQGRAVPSAHTASYVEARQRLPADLLRAVHGHLAQAIERQCGPEGRWRGLRVKAIDATSAQMPDTPANQRAYPQPGSEAEGCGFPVVQLSGLIDLGHGGLWDFASSPVAAHEMRGFERLEGELEPGDVVVGDRLYSSYEVVARLKARGIWFIGRNHQSRKADFRAGRRLGPDERLQVWRKPAAQPPGSRLSPEEWEALPPEIAVRIIRTRKRDREGNVRTMYVVTTLTDAEAYPAQEVASIYLHRWEIELRFRDIKTTMGMEVLRTHSPEMVEKEILMHMIAYNLVKLLMLKASAAHGVSHRRISFKGVLQVVAGTLAAFAPAVRSTRALAREKANLLERLAERAVKERPGRNEVRKKKRRPKSYGWLQRPRHAYLETYHNDNPPFKILDAAA